MKYNPIESWTKLQKIYYLIQLRKLIVKIGNRGERDIVFDKTIKEFKISYREFEEQVLKDKGRNNTTKRLFADITLEEKTYILASYLIVLLVEDDFEYEEYLITCTLFTNIFGSSFEDTAELMNLIFENNPLLEFEFHAKKIEKQQNKKPGQIITRYTVVYLVIMALVIIGLISIFT